MLTPVLTPVVSLLCAPWFTCLWGLLFSFLVGVVRVQTHTSCVGSYLPPHRVLENLVLSVG